MRQFLKVTLRVLLLASVLPAILSCSVKSGDKKDKALWICFDHSHPEIYVNPDSARFYLDKAKEIGFNRIIVDVKGSRGPVLYESSFLPALADSAGVPVCPDFDYADFYIKEARARGMKITFAVTPFAVGCPILRVGQVYQEDSLKNYTCLNYRPSGMIKIEDDSTEVSAFLNPALKFSHDYGLRTLREILTKYDIDGICLDYCRYPGIQADFSDSSKVMFENYLGHSVENFPQDIFTYDDAGMVVPGKYFNQWCTWRAMVIHDFVRDVRSLVDETKPDVSLEYWAASWLHALNVTGQNWASDQADYYKSLPWATPDYGKTGFASYLDVFQTGTYLEKVWGADDPVSIEYGLARTDRDIAGDCRVLGSLYAKNTVDQFVDAVELCVRNTSGVMVFDLSWVIKNDLWDEIADGFKRGELPRR